MFESLLRKIRDAEWSNEPFRHIEIKNLFSPELFNEITSAPEIQVGAVQNDRELVSKLDSLHWKPIPFPGTTDNIQTYLAWRDKKKKHTNRDTTEGYGVTYRLYEAGSPIIKQLHEFLQTKEFQDCLCEKFGVNPAEISYDAGIQKYLDGYEISPHPDIKRKALTYMANINPAPNSEELNFHTHYMKFKDKYAYVQSYWMHNERSERCWVPWDWCETVKQQTENNSMVIFSPDHTTMHAIRAHYDHLPAQRTQLYGNFWYNEIEVEVRPEWQSYVIKEPVARSLKQLIPFEMKEQLKVLMGRRSSKAGQRFVKS